MTEARNALQAPSHEMAVHARQLDFHSTIRQRDYRLLISTPGKPAPPGGHPVVYLIDGNLHFGIAVDTMRVQACWPDMRDAVIVGIGYPTDRVAEALGLRMQDLTTPITEAMAQVPWYRRMPPPVRGYGHLDDYLRMLDEEVKPRVAAVAPIDANDQALMGHSLGGLTTLHALFRRTASFQHFVAIAPSIWWNHREVLQHEAGFVQRVRAGEVRARVLVSVGGLESTVRYPSVGAEKLPASKEEFQQMVDFCRMVPDAEELGARLAAEQRPGFTVQTVVHAGDDHNMVPPAGIARGIRFALRTE
ncbi:MAG: alpha/beta hydrolase [Betaproteobacteria bacterium]|jgi:predicted alpha/beta superfamily hydrolase|nr:alpha/beta hydrolase-fold protein [Rubrivivax sp.]